MAEHPPPPLDDRVVGLVRTWLEEAAGHRLCGSGAQLAALLGDPHGLAFAVGFVDGVVRPEDPAVAAHRLRELAAHPPAFLPAPLRRLVQLGGAVGPLAPRVVVPVARRVLRAMVGHLVVDASDARLGPAIAKIRAAGQGEAGDIRLNINLLGEAVLGKREADRRLEGTERLLRRDDVDYVSIKVSSAVAPHSPWAFDEAVEDVVAHLRPLFRRAAAATPHKFINLDMEEYRDLDLTIAVFTRLLDEPDQLDLEAGIVLQAYLPDALGGMQRLQSWAAGRRARGGAGIKVRLVKGANLPMEQVEASIHGWPLATWPTKQDTDTHYKQVLDWAMTPERIANVRVGVAGHNLFDVARAWLVAGDRGVRDGIDFEMLLGMAPGQAEAVRRTVGGLLLYTPVVHPDEFDVAIAYLVRRLEEGASNDNFLPAVFDLADRPELFAREEARYRASTAAMTTLEPTARRVADRYAAVGRPTSGRFGNTPDSDPAVAEQRQWGRAILAAAPTSTLGRTEIEAARVTDPGHLDNLLGAARRAGQAWAAWSGADREAVLHAVGDALNDHRADLIEVMVAEAAKTFDQADPEVSEATDFAHFYGDLAEGLDRMDGATFTPRPLTLVTPPWNFPVAIPTGSTLAALAAGSAVVLKPAGPAERCGAVLAHIIGEALAAAGAPPDLVTLVQVDEGTLGPTLVAHPLVDQVILTGAYETAELFRSLRPDLRLFAETSGKNAIIVTPSADLDLAVRDIVHSAYGHAGQKCSAASLVVLVGSVATSRRFARQLQDAVASLTVGPPEDPTTQMGPVIEQASGKLLDGLTSLGTGERWLLEPRQLDDAGRMWTPGLRDGVRRGSAFHTTEYFGPILGIMTAATLDEAIDLVNEVDFGLTSGLHSLDPDEIATWLDRVEAGNLYVNKGITGAIVRRQPFGGWKRSAVGAGAKAGGVNYLLALGAWEPRAAHDVTGPGNADVLALLDRTRPHLAAADHDRLTRAAGSAARHWADEFATATDVSALTAERNVARYRPWPAPVTVRLQDGTPTDLLCIVSDAATAGARVQVSVGPSSGVSDALAAVVRSAAPILDYRVESDDVFAEGVGAGRIRLIAPHPATVASRRADVAVYAGPVTEAGRLELLPFVREQAVSITAHRFGTPDHLTDDLL